MIVIEYFLKVFLTSGIFLIFYNWALKDTKLHNFNRYYLMSSLGASLILPSFVIRIAPTIIGTQLQNINAAVVRNLGGTIKESQITGVQIALIIYSIVTLLAFIKLACNILSVFKLKRNGSSIRSDGYTIVYTDVSDAPFSFFRTIFWRSDMSMSDEIGSKIFKHELAHVKSYHSIDVMIFRIVLTIFWINPFYWLLFRELMMVHEYSADAQALENGDTDIFARMMLRTIREKQIVKPVNYFFNSNLKRRLLMLTESGSQRLNHWRLVAGIPLLVFAIFLTLIACKKEAREQALTDWPTPLSASQQLDSAFVEIQTESGSEKGWMKFVRVDSPRMKWDSMYTDVTFMHLDGSTTTEQGWVKFEVPAD